MARADSTVRVNIIGDAKSLTKAADKAEGAFGGMGKQAVKVGGIIAGAFAVDAVADFASTALREGDRVADATARLESQLGKLADPLKENAGHFLKLGQSSQDMLELEARLVDIGKAAGIADEDLAPMAQDSAEVAAAMALMTDIPADEWISKIGKAAASGDMRSLRDLGINLDESAVNARALADTGKPTVDALTEEEKAAARLALILEGLRDRTKEVTDGQGDFEQKTAETQAKMEELEGKLGPMIDGVLSDLLDFINDGIDGWILFAHWVDTNRKGIAEAATPFARFADILGSIVGFVQELNKISLPAWMGNMGSGAAPFNDPRFQFNSGTSVRRSGGGPVTVQVQGGSPEAIEQAVRNAVYTASRHG